MILDPVLTLGTDKHIDIFVQGIITVPYYTYMKNKMNVNLISSRAVSFLKSTEKIFKISRRMKLPFLFLTLLSRCWYFVDIKKKFIIQEVVPT